MNWHDIFEYKDGRLYWKVNIVATSKQPTRIIVGGEAGHFVGNGYFYMSWKSKQTKRSRVVWEMHNGPIPKGALVEHKDQNKLNDRIENLRLSTKSQNSYNIRKRKNSKTLYKGCKKNSKHDSYMARITFNKKEIYLGTFKELKDAAQMYNYKIRQYAGEFAVLNDSGEYEEWF
jgi:hypothetical protein